jgi:hypothetical protein
LSHSTQAAINSRSMAFILRDNSWDIERLAGGKQAAVQI